MFGLAIHGGAGTLPRAEMSAAREVKYRDGLAAALEAGYALLQGGATSLDAVTHAVMLLEDNPLFNAGLGSVFTFDGHNELDAAIMDGSTLKAGAVCGVDPYQKSGPTGAHRHGAFRIRHAERRRCGRVCAEPRP